MYLLSLKHAAEDDERFRTSFTPAPTDEPYSDEQNGIFKEPTFKRREDGISYCYYIL